MRGRSVTWNRAVLAALLGLLGVPAWGALKADTATAPSCADCHADQAAAFAANPHARAARHGAAAVSGDAVCVSCHGDGAKHMEASGAEPISRATRGADGAEACLSCHREQNQHQSYRNGIHAPSATVSCSTCHSIHASDPKTPHLLVKPPTALCATCHPGPADSFKSKPFAIRLGRGGIECTSCHDPHGRPGRESLKLTRDDKLPCINCHAEKRGPFVFEHVIGVAGDCTTCHEPHGSSNPRHLVRAQVRQVCLECHSTLTPGLLGSQPPAIHDLLSPRYQNCTVCHTAIHGSNRSPKLFK